MLMVLPDCRIEGIDPMITKFQQIYASIKKKPYDPLDHRKVEFENDYADITKQINDLQVR